MGVSYWIMLNGKDDKGKVLHLFKDDDYFKEIHSAVKKHYPDIDEYGKFSKDIDEECLQDFFQAVDIVCQKYIEDYELKISVPISREASLHGRSVAPVVLFHFQTAKVLTSYNLLLFLMDSDFMDVSHSITDPIFKFKDGTRVKIGWRP